jgi:hypothetical protein
MNVKLARTQRGSKHRLDNVFGKGVSYTRMWKGECYRLPGQRRDVAAPIPPPWHRHIA